MYLRVETRFNRVERNYDGDEEKVHEGLSIFSQNGRLVGQATDRWLSDVDYQQARIYVLKTCTDVWHFIQYEYSQSEIYPSSYLLLLSLIYWIKVILLYL